MKKIIAIIFIPLLLLFLPLSIYASLRINTGTGRVTHGSATSLDNLEKFTHMYWVKKTGTGTQIMSKTGGTNAIRLRMATSSASNVDVVVERSTAPTLALTSSNPLTELNKWYFIAFTFDSSAASTEVLNIYQGDLNTMATESTYTYKTSGSGTKDDSGGNLIIINQNNGGAPWNGDIAFGASWNRVLSLEEIRMQQFFPRVTTGNIVFTFYGNNTSTQIDYSGLRNHGDIIIGTGPFMSAGTAIRPSLRR